MKKIENAKQTFIESAVRVVARDGLDKTTTKAIAADAGLNEAFMGLSHKAYRMDHRKDGSRHEYA